MKEIPGEAKIHVQPVHWIMRYKETVTAATGCMCHIYINATMFQVEICIGIKYGITTQFHLSVIGILHGKQSGSRMIVRCSVIRKETQIRSYLAAQYLGYSEKEIEIGVYVYCR